MPPEQATASPVRRLWRWLKRQIVEDVPSDIAVCEYDCRKEQCLQSEWETCERRLSAAAGELHPPQETEEPRRKAASGR
jgi:hypothetical protein